MFSPNMDVEEEIRVKKEPLDFKEGDMDKGQLFEQISRLDENERMKFYLGLNIKDEIETKDEPLDFDEEEMEKDQVFDQTSGLDENQTLISDEDYGEKDARLKVKSSLKSGPQTSRRLNQRRKKKDLKELNCVHCNLNFKNHMKSHGKRKLKCAHCSFECNRKPFLKRHLLKHSNNESDESVLECEHKSSLQTQTERINDLTNTVLNYRDKDGRQVSEVFFRLPLKSQYPNYYEVIEQPIDFHSILQKRKSGCYSSLDDIKNDLILMFQNACQYNEPESQIYRDALTLQRLVMQKTLELCRQDEFVPNVLGLVQEILLSLFISVFNHEIFEGRYTAESFSDLPEYVEKIDGQRTKALNFAIMKRRLDKDLYTRLDHFQDDLFSIFDRARDISKENSRIFADSIILQKEFIKVRDELCGKGSILSSKALGFNERQLNKVLIMQAKIFKRIGKDEELTEDTSDEITEDEDLKTFVQQQKENADNSNSVSHNQIQYFVGDFVYVIPPEKNCDFPILHIRQLWKNKAGEEMCYGCQYYRPAETSDLPTKEFYEQEVFKTEKHMSLPLSEVIGKCIVLSSVDYSRLRVDNFHEKDVYVCEYHYSTKNKIFKKIEIWPYSLPEGTQITERVKHLVMRRGEFIFKEQIGEHKEKLAELADETKIINHLPNVLKSTVLDIKGNIYYKQYSSGSVTIKLGDFVYTRNRGIIHVIGIWITSEEEAFISGTRYVHAHDVAIITDRKPYKTEVYLTFKLETLSLSEIIGKCCVLYIKEYITQRHTEIPESDVYLCEKFYNEMSQRLITLKNGILKFTNFPPEIYPNEIYYFWKPLNPKNIESGLPLEMKKIMEQPISPTVPEVVQEDCMNDRPPSVASSDSSLPPTPTTPIPISTTKPSKKKPSVGRKFFQQKSRKNQVSGYNLFYAEIWRSLRQRNPDLDFGKLARLVSIEWKKLTETERKTFDNKAHQRNLKKGNTRYCTL